MAENLDPIKQVIQIDVNENGTAEATEKVQGLNKAINNTVIENKKSEDSFKSLKVQLREAIIEQQKLADKFGATSDQAIKAAKAVAGIKDEIGLQKDLVDSFNPDDKFRALTQTAGVAALALGGVKDGFTALGIESEVLDKVIGSAQAILGVTSAVAGMSDAYAVLTASKRAKSAADVVEIGTTEALAVANTEATVTTWSWNAALLANPIVLITAGIVAAGAAIYAYIKITGDAVKAEEKAKVASMQLDQAIEHQSKTFEKNSDSNSRNNDFKLALLKASGASEAQILRETKALKEQEIQMGINASAEAYRLLLKAQQLNSDNPTDFTEKSLQSAKENYKRMQDFVDNSFNDLEDIRNNAEVAKVQAETDARLKREEAQKKAIDDEKQRKKEALENELKDRKEIQAQSDEFATFIAQNKIKQEEEAKQKQIKQEEETKAKREDNFRALQEDADRQLLIEQSLLDQKIAIEDAKIGIAERGIQLIAGVFGKSKAVQKAAIIAENAIGIGKQIIANNIANAGALATPQAIASSGASAVPVIALNNISTGIGIASTVAATAKALSAIGGGGASAGGAGGSQTPQPSRNVAQVGFQASSENQIGNAVANQQKQQPPIQAFVVSQSVRDAEELARKKELVNSF
jgi:hypothetical protein